MYLLLYIFFFISKVDFLIGDEVGNMIRWDIRANKSEALVKQFPRTLLVECILNVLNIIFKFKEPVQNAIRSISINQEGTQVAAVNNEVKYLNQ